MLRKLFFFACLIVFTANSYAAKKQSVDEMRQALTMEKDAEEKVKLLYQIAWKMRKTQHDSASYYVRKSLLLSEEIGYKEGIIKSYTIIGVIHKNLGEYEDALRKYNKAIKIAQEIEDKNSLAKLYNNIGIVYKSQGFFDLASDYYQKSITIKEGFGRNKGLANSYANLGVVFKEQGKYAEALKYYFQALALREELNDKEGLANSYGHIGVVYKNQNLFDKAEESHLKSLDIRKEINDLPGQASSFNNLGILYRERKVYEKAVLNYQKAIDIYEGVGNKAKMALAYINLGECYSEFDRSKGLKFLLKGESLAKEIENKALVLNANSALGNYFQEKGDQLVAAKYFQEAIDLAAKLGKSEDLVLAYKKIAESHYRSKMFKRAYNELYEYTELNSDLQNDKMRDDLARMDAIYENSKLEAEIGEMQIQQEASERQRYLQWIVFSVAMFSALVISLIVYRSIQARKKSFVEIQKQKAKVEEQHYLISEKNKEITDSILYAKRIQNAILPSTKILHGFMGEHFVLFHPKDIVSGDFYWAQQKGSKVFFTAADCTGHGVPGAMVSVVCSNMLTKVIQEIGVETPSYILDMTSKLLEKNFDSGDDEGIADGMDLSLCCFDKESKILEFAGANNPLYIVKSKDSSLYSKMPVEPNIETETCGLFEIKADPQPIGKYFAREPFTNHSIQMEKGDLIYSFTDGFADQFGGPKGKKYKYKPFKRYLLSIQDQPLHLQCSMLLNEFETWRAMEEQIDDVCIMAAKVD